MRISGANAAHPIRTFRRRPPMPAAVAGSEHHDVLDRGGRIGRHDLARVPVNIHAHRRLAPLLEQFRTKQTTFSGRRRSHDRRRPEPSAARSEQPLNTRKMENNDAGGNLSVVAADPCAKQITLPERDGEQYPFRALLIVPHLMRGRLSRMTRRAGEVIYLRLARAGLPPTVMTKLP